MPVPVDQRLHYSLGIFQVFHQCSSHTTRGRELHWAAHVHINSINVILEQAYCLNSYICIICANLQDEAAFLLASGAKHYTLIACTHKVYRVQVNIHHPLAPE